MCSETSTVGRGFTADYALIKPSMEICIFAERFIYYTLGYCMVVRRMFSTLKQKITWVYLLLVLLTAGIGVTSVLNLYHHEKAVDGLMTDNYKSISALSKAVESLERQDSAMHLFISVDEAQGLQIFDENQRLAHEYITIEQGNTTESGEREVAAELADNYSRYVAMFSALQAIRKGQGEEAAIGYYTSTVAPLFTEIKSQLNQLIGMNETAMFASKNKATQDVQQSVYLLISLTAAAVVAGFLLSRFFANRFLRPLSQLTGSISRVDEGSMDQHIEIKSNDEIGTLAREFNKMTARLNQYEQSSTGMLINEKNKSLAIVKSISDPLIVTDGELKITLINHACEKYFGIREEDVAGRHVKDALNNKKLYEIISRLVKGENVKETMIYLPQEEGYYFNVITTRIQGARTQGGGHILLLQNVTELKKLEQVKTNFVATVSHEFKTPLTSILMGADMLAQPGIVLNPDQTEILNAIQEDGERLSTLVNDLLELSRIESGKAIYHMRPCSIYTIAEESCQQFLDKAERKGVKLINNLKKGLPKVTADMQKIAWVLNNLLSNALKYTDTGDTISINASEGRETLTLSVEDTGMGIPEKYLPRLFEKYFQVKGQDIEVPGTGLGLSVVKEIICAHSGEIWVKSKLDSGSRFYFTLPLAKKVDEI